MVVAVDRVQVAEVSQAEIREIVSVDSFDDALDRIDQFYEAVVDVETNGLLPWHGDRLCGVGVGVSAQEGYYFPFRHERDLESNLPLEWIDQLWDVLAGMRRILGHNLKFDLSVMYQDGYDPPIGQSLADTLVAARLSTKNPWSPLGLTPQLAMWLGDEYIQYEKEFLEYLRVNRIRKKYHLAPAAVTGDYCIGDVLGTWKLNELYEQIISSTRQQGVWETEQAQTWTLWQMEKEGIRYDEEYGAMKIPQLTARIDSMANEVYSLAGREFNLNSNPQLTEVMHSLGIYSPKKSSKTGKDSWEGGVMLSIDHPIAGKIVELRSLEKVRNTYFVGITNWPDATVHCQHKNWGTITGRLSCTNPNMQNIAKNVQNLQGNEVSEETMAAVSAMLGARKGQDYESMRTEGGGRAGGVTVGGLIAVASEYGEDPDIVSVRRLFVGRPGYRLHMLDYSQMEMRVFADYVQDSGLHALLESSDFDFHSYVAKTVWGVDESSSLWNFYRTLAKAINFGLIYGIGVKKLAAQLQCGVEEAEQYRLDYFQRFPRAETFISEVMNTVESRGYIFNRFKRRYYIEKKRAYVGVNYLVQGTSADIVKNRMNACQKYIEDNSLKSRMLIQVHDEMLFDIHLSEESWLPFKFQEIMQEKQIDTFLPVEVSRGNPSWAQVEQYDKEAGEWKTKT